MKRRPLFIIGLALLCGSVALADTVILKDQRKFTGKVIRVTETEVQIETDEGAMLTFSAEKVEKIDRPAPKKPGAAPKAPLAPASLRSLQQAVSEIRDELQQLRARNASLAKQMKEMKEVQEKLEKLSGEVSEIGTRASRLPPKRGDFAGTKDRSKFRFEDVKIERGGDEYKIHGYIRNVGSSPGVWLRIITELRDDRDRVLVKNDINPTFNPSGSHEARDKSVLSPGERFEFDTYVPYGRWASSRDNMGIKRDVRPPGVTHYKNIADKMRVDLTRKQDEGMYIELRIEVPPKEPEEEGKGKRRPRSATRKK